MTKQVRQRFPKYVVARVVDVTMDDEPQTVERHDSWVDSSHERSPQYDYDAVIPVSRQRIGFQL